MLFKTIEQIGGNDNFVLMINLILIFGSRIIYVKPARHYHNVAFNITKVQLNQNQFQE